MDQPIPRVTSDDVECVVRRGFASEQYAAAMTVLGEYGQESWQRETPCVQLALLKLADGNLDTLREAIVTAKSDYRDVLAYAEYPGCTNTPASYNLLPEEQKKIIDEDWRQYESWLNR